MTPEQCLELVHTSSPRIQDANNFILQEKFTVEKEVQVVKAERMYVLLQQNKTGNKMPNVYLHIRPRGHPGEPGKLLLIAG